jgi:hypothetical protein
MLVAFKVETRLPNEVRLLAAVAIVPLGSRARLLISMLLKTELERR